MERKSLTEGSCRRGGQISVYTLKLNLLVCIQVVGNPAKIESKITIKDRSEWIRSFLRTRPESATGFPVRDYTPGEIVHAPLIIPTVIGPAWARTAA